MPTRGVVSELAGKRSGGTETAMSREPVEAMRDEAARLAAVGEAAG